MITSIVFILLFIGFLFAAYKKDPIFGLMFYVFLYFLNPHYRWWGSFIPNLPYAFITGIAIFGSYAINYKKYSSVKIFNFPQTKWLFLLLLILILIWPIALVPDEHRKIIILIFKLVLLYIIFIKVTNSPNKMKYLIWAFLIGQLYWGWIAIGMPRFGGRLEGLGAADSLDSNFTAASVVPAIPLLLNIFIWGNKWERIGTFVVSAFTVNTLILLNSRGAFLATIFAVFSYTFFYLKTKSSNGLKKSTLILTLIIGLSGSLYLTEDIFWRRMYTLEDPSTEGSGYRMITWMGGLKAAIDHPLGVGRRGFLEISPKYVPEKLLSNNGKRAVHNTYIQALTDLGFLGFIIFMGFILSTLNYLNRIKKILILRERKEEYFLAVAFTASFLGFLFTAIFINLAYIEMLYLLTAYIAALGNSYNKFLVS